MESRSLGSSPMHKIVLKHCPKAKLFGLEGPAVVGTVILGMEQAKFDGYPVRGTMIKTAKQILG